MTKHTPGPWAIFEQPEGFGEIFQKPDDSDNVGRCIGLVLREDDFDLVAAAPETAAERDRLREINAELLAALKALCHDGPKQAPHPYASATMQHRWKNFEAARAAIAKAEGGNDA